MTKPIVSCRMTEEMVGKLDEVAEHGKLTRCEVMRRMIQFYIDEMDEFGVVWSESARSCTAKIRRTATCT